MKIVSITDPATANGLKLAGVKEAHETDDSGEAEKILRRTLEEKEVGIIILTEKLAENMGENLDELKQKKTEITPIIIEIPGKEGPVPERREIIDKLVKRAVGIKVER